MIIKAPRTSIEMDEVRRLFREYEAYLDVDLCFQGFEEELAGLPGNYAPPDGALLVGLKGSEAVGCVAVRRLDAATCEMKRLYVKPHARRSGLGRRLAREIISAAQALDYSLMRLDTLDKLSEAMRLYESLGFRRTGPYYANPLPGVVYWELDLSQEKKTHNCRCHPQPL
jgi:ribosomal protein S18 acetylase RimI-like enzyme